MTTTDLTTLRTVRAHTIAALLRTYDGGLVARPADLWRWVEASGNAIRALYDAHFAHQRDNVGAVYNALDDAVALGLVIRHTADGRRPTYEPAWRFGPPYRHVLAQVFGDEVMP